MLATSILNFTNYFQNASFNPLPNKNWTFIHLLKTLGGKGEIARDEQFFLITVFSTLFKNFLENCLQSLSVWNSPKFVIWAFLE